MIGNIIGFRKQMIEFLDSGKKEKRFYILRNKIPI